MNEMVYLCSYFKGAFPFRKFLRHGAEGFIFPPKEGVLRIIIALQNSLSSVECEPANLGEPYTTDDDFLIIISVSFLPRFVSCISSFIPNPIFVAGYIKSFIISTRSSSPVYWEPSQ
jgi:hypothetical protein